MLLGNSTDITPEVVIGLLLTVNELLEIPTLLTVPNDELFAILVTLPYESIVTVGLVYDPGVTPVFDKSTTIFPELTIGELLTDKVLEVTPALVTVPLLLPFPPPVDEIVTFPFELLIVMFVPAVILVTPVLVIVTVFVLASLLAAIPIPLAKLLYGLAHANRFAKLFAVLLKAVYNESLFADSFCNPTAIISSPEIAIF
jgi:hypothetical protein